MIKDSTVRDCKFLSQPKDFGGLRWGNIIPTDIDGFLDFGNRLFIFFELKYGDAKMPLGQRLALERQCDRCQQGGVNTYTLIIQHWDTGIIEVARGIVIEYRYKGMWCIPFVELNTKEQIDFLLESNGFRT
jgi:hypothetical protein